MTPASSQGHLFSDTHYLALDHGLRFSGDGQITHKNTLQQCGCQTRLDTRRLVQIFAHRCFLSFAYMTQTSWAVQLSNNNMLSRKSTYARKRKLANMLDSTRQLPNGSPSSHFYESSEGTECNEVESRILKMSTKSIQCIPATS